MIAKESELNEAVPIVLGPTAVGKSELVHSVARKIEGEIISADSRAIYRGMDIGTATPPPAYREEIPYHLVNFLHPRKRYSAADFSQDVEEKIKEIRGRGRKPIIEGGSRLYIVALTQGIFEGPEADEQLREELREEPNEQLHERLSEVDPRTAEKVHPNDTKRLVRALEVYELTGEMISKLKEEAEPLPVKFLKIGLDRPRQQLYERANERVDKMLEKGLMDEVEALMDKGFGPDWGAWETIGYKELVLYLKGEYEFDEAVEEIKKNTRHLAKYQQNWMEKIEGITRFDLEEDRGVENSLLDLVRGS